MVLYRFHWNSLSPINVWGAHSPKAPCARSPKLPSEPSYWQEMSQNWPASLFTIGRWAILFEESSTSAFGESEFQWNRFKTRTKLESSPHLLPAWSRSDVLASSAAVEWPPTMTSTPSCRPSRRCPQPTKSEVPPSTAEGKARCLIRLNKIYLTARSINDRGDCKYS